jgi:hypothetical protein
MPARTNGRQDPNRVSERRARRSATATAVNHLSAAVSLGLHTLSKRMEDRALPRETRVDRLTWTVKSPFCYYSEPHSDAPPLAGMA